MKKALAAILCLVIIFAFFGCSKKEEPTTTQTTTQTTVTTTKKEEIKNPLTGKAGYKKSAVGKRPVAIVVENLSPARPQWGIKTPDIIVEGEVEGGISRMLWLYADYKSVPEKIGPIRSARPSYVKFSEFFDSIYVHWGGSHQRKAQGYIGGYTLIRKDKVDHIDGMDGGILFGRDSTRRVSSEHRGIVHGKKLSKVIKQKGFRTKLDSDKFSSLSFNDKVEKVGKDKAEKVNVTFSSRTDTRKFTYKKGKYHTKDWEKDVAFQNVIILKDRTKYITTPYKGSSTTYLNYLYTGSEGYYISNGTRTPIKWEVKDNKLYLKDSEGKALKLNPGKSYIGLASSNNGGTVTFS